MQSALSGTTPVTLRDLGRILVRRRGIALLTFAVTVAVTLAVTSRIKPTYEASCEVLLDSSPPMVTTGNMFDLLSGASSTAGDVEIAKIKSRAFVSEIIRRLNIGAVTTPDDLKGRLNVTVSAGGQILLIDVRFPRDANLTAKIANTAAEVYREYVLQDADRKNEVSIDRLRRARDKAGEEKKVADAALFTFMQQRGISDPASYYVRRSSKTLDVKNALEESQRDIPLKEKRIELLRQQVQSIPPEIVSGYTLNKNTQLESFQDQIISLQYDKRVKLLDYGPQSPEVVEIDKKIAETQHAEKQAQADAYRKGSLGISRNPDYQTALTNLYNTKLELETTRRNIVSLQGQLNDLQAEQRKLAPESVLFQELQRQVEITTEAYQKANTALLQMPINRITNVQNIRILEPARVPGAAESPKPLLNLILAIFGGAFLGLAVAITAEYFSGSRPIGASDSAPLPLVPGYRPLAIESSYSGLPTIAGAPLLARVPMGRHQMPAPAGAGLPLAPLQNASAEDAFREIGYTLAHRVNDGSGRVPVILLTGTRSDETTASIASYLTATLVRDGMRVTLVDADRTEPRLNTVFGKPDAPGLTDILAGRVPFREALHTGASGNLRFLAAGAADDPTVIDEEPLRRLFSDLSSEADTDLVIVSGPSVWSARLVVPMERAANGLVLVASDAAVAPEESVARARRILSNGYQPRLLGVIVGEGPPEGDEPRPALLHTVVKEVAQ